MKRVVPILLGLGLAWSASAEVAGTNAPAPLPDGDEGPDRGFYLGCSLLGTSFTLDLDDRATPTVADFDFDDLGIGAEMFCGVMFGPRFRLEFAGGVAVHDASPGDAKVVESGARVTGYMPLIAGRQVEPSLLAGLGASGLIFTGEDFEDRFYASVQGDLGLGVRIRVTRHQFLQSSFLYTNHDVEREIIDIEDGDDDVDLRHVGGRGWTRSLRFGWGWDF